MNESSFNYKKRISAIEDLLEFHPEYLNVVSKSGRDVLSHYYFAGRAVDVDDLDEYRSALLAREPDLEEKALAVFERLKAATRFQ